MANYRLPSALAAAGVIVGVLISGTACSTAQKETATETQTETAAEVPADLFEAVGTGTFEDPKDGPGGAGVIAGFRATGATEEEASAAVIKACQDAGGADCTSDEVSNDKVCIASVADDTNDVVAGGAGATIEDAKKDALKRAADNGTPLTDKAFVVISACWDDE